ELFLGQLTHSIPEGASSLVVRWNSFARAVFDFVNTIAKSIAVLPSLTISQAASSVLNSARTSAGTSANDTRNPALMPNFFGSGVSEYPGMMSISTLVDKYLNHEVPRRYLTQNVFLREPSCPSWLM